MGIKHKDKIFVVQRRGGGHGTIVIPNPEDWSTPRFMYFNTNMFGQLPAPLDNNGEVDTLLTIAVADDVTAKAVSASIKLRSGCCCPIQRRKTYRTISDFSRSLWRPSVTPTPFRMLQQAKGRSKDQIEVRVNNILLGTPTVEEGWLVFAVQPKFLAVGDNLVGVRVTQALR